LRRTEPNGMVKVDLESVYRVRAKGRTYYYAWKGKGAPRLQGEPGSREFISSLAEALQDRAKPDATRVRGLITAYKGSDAWLVDISAGTRKVWAPWLDRISDEFGSLRVSTFRRPDFADDIEAWRDRFKATPRAADMGMQVLSRLLSFGKVNPNPCAVIGKLYRNDRSDIIWTDDELADLAKHASKQLMWAVRMAALTGMRQDDCRKLTWSEVGDLAIERGAGKSVRQYRQRSKSYLVPMHAELKALLTEIEADGRKAVQVLTNTHGKPWRSGLSDSFGDAARRAGIDKHFHDLRGTAATWLYKAGFSEREIAEILAWEEDQVSKIIRRYVSRDALLRDRIERLDRHRHKDQA
jgi:integrase